MLDYKTFLQLTAKLAYDRESWRKENGTMGAKLMLVVGFYQVLGALTDDGTFGHGSNPNSPELMQVTKLFDFVNMDPFGLPFVHCFGLSFVNRMYISGLVPFAMLGVLLIPTCAGIMSEDKFWKYAYTLINFVFPKTCNTVLRVFRCRSFIHDTLMVLWRVEPCRCASSAGRPRPGGLAT